MRFFLFQNSKGWQSWLRPHWRQFRWRILYAVAESGTKLVGEVPKQIHQRYVLTSDPRQRKENEFEWNWIAGPVLANNMKTDTNANITADQMSKGSFDSSTEFSSELEEVYEQFSKWLDDPILKDNMKSLDPRDEAVLNFASSLLKRTLSESFVGVPLTEGCITSTCKQMRFTAQNESKKMMNWLWIFWNAGIPAEENSLHSYQNKQKNRQIINARSLSLELAKQKHRLAAQLVSASPAIE